MYTWVVDRVLETESEYRVQDECYTTWKYIGFFYIEYKGFSFSPLLLHALTYLIGLRNTPRLATSKVDCKPNVTLP